MYFYVQVDAYSRRGEKQFKDIEKEAYTYQRTQNTFTPKLITALKRPACGSALRRLSE